jgi:sodium-dependent dicarboxylate transporter 2/3/5
VGERDSQLARRVRRTGLILGPCLAVLTGIALSGSDLGYAGRVTAAVAVWMATWWMTEAIPIPATGLIPIAAFPLAGVRTAREAAAPYGHELIYLFLGGFVLALAMERWGLHRRIALAAVRLVGTRADRMVAAFIGTTAVLSMWVSNTATAILMLPIASSLIRHSDSGGRAFAPALLLAIAYGASIGGVATLIGTPPNLFLASFARDHLDVDYGFARWLGMALPLVLVLLVILWVMLTRVLYRCRDEQLAIQDLGERPGAMNRGEKLTLVVFVMTAGLWILRPVLTPLEPGGVAWFGGLTDSGIAITAALVLFVLPAGDGRRVMDWHAMRRLPWGLLILFGGGLSLAAAMQDTGVSARIGELLAQRQGLSPLVAILMTTTLMVFLTELTSNTATTAAMLPILTAAASGLGLPPVLIATAAAVSASCAFMLPVATPPNAIVFGSGDLRIGQMVRAGIGMNLICILAVTAWVMLIVGPWLGV